MAFPYYQTLTYTSAATEASIGLDPGISPFNASIVCTVLGGATVSYQLQYTLNPLGGPTATDSSANWSVSPDIPAGTTASSFTSFITPVARVRVVIASLSGGSLQIEVLQGLSIN